jgi:hypothetical protein
MNLVDWFDVYNKEHMIAYEYLTCYGYWPEGFISEDIKVNPLDIISIQNKLAEAWVTYFLRE